MKRDRFWFGTAMVAVPMLFFLASMSPGIALTRSGPVEGHVSFHGRPLAGGSILFVPEDTRQGVWAMAWIDEDGYYTIDSAWTRKASASKMRYRICLMPDSHKMAVKGRRKLAMKTSWSGTGTVGFPAPDASSGFPAQVCDPKTTRFEAVLGTEPAQVDVAF